MDLRTWKTLRELDAARGWNKGQAFRVFKALAPGWTEGRDYVVLDAGEHVRPVAQLRAAGRLYDSSVKLILLSPAMAEAVLRSD